jgi:hypothetical protein
MLDAFFFPTFASFLFCFEFGSGSAPLLHPLASVSLRSVRNQ